jgi:preprotein translocase subunit SecG
MLLAAVDWLHYLFIIPLCLVSLFLILVILVQRGRGGGLTGALGGMGGASAFGTKAGDLFTRITIGVAAVWILLAMAALKVLNDRSPLAGARPGPAATVPGTLNPDQNPASEDKAGATKSPPTSKATGSGKAPVGGAPAAGKTPPASPAAPAKSTP